MKKITAGHITSTSEQTAFILLTKTYIGLICQSFVDS